MPLCDAQGAIVFNANFIEGCILYMRYLRYQNERESKILLKRNWNWTKVRALDCNVSSEQGTGDGALNLCIENRRTRIFINAKVNCHIPPSNDDSFGDFGTFFIEQHDDDDTWCGWRRKPPEFTAKFRIIADRRLWNFDARQVRWSRWCVSAKCQSTVFSKDRGNSEDDDNDNDTYEKWPKFPFRFSRSINFPTEKRKKISLAHVRHTLRKTFNDISIFSHCVRAECCVCRFGSRFKCECGKKMSRKKKLCQQFFSWYIVIVIVPPPTEY